MFADIEHLYQTDVKWFQLWLGQFQNIIYCCQRCLWGCKVYKNLCSVWMRSQQYIICIFV